ncbi:hypothetical protein SCO11_01985 [Legionella pneumophila serogroup 1]|uniref:hypothetical protein n=1 Tax=Legionella pneumophila TaxID=446 RepID=UPI0004820911|nr:hypothetical protein [Legionella pneumophila]AMV13829.1 hypothetical protein ULM_11460 [Legionella pneumophila]ANN92121.1 hypothetical protein A9P85_05565 [Legionella pneumophila]MCZ4678767.1 hypothetical protein [Legionella pneumophila]MCZ4703485.1 hypothetical protein [Legionella pneumophila]MCZ4750540.1 hypothetical protein [Legionella pneumophila]
MTKELARPDWYNDEFYNKTRTPEEWLYELWKRDRFNRDKTGLPHSIRKLPIKEQEQYFIDVIFEQKIEKMLSFLKPTPPKPIRDVSISDVFIMYHLVTNTDWYKNNPHREAFESAISAITNKDSLSMEQKIAFHEMHETPWCVFYENYQQDSWCPKKEMEYLSGLLFSLDPAYSRKDTLTVLKRKLNASVGKLQDIQVQFERWQESKILAVFDLMLWFKIQGVRFTNIGLHKLIWPKGRVSSSTGQGVNPYDDIDHSIKLANKVIDRSSISSLLIMCEARKFKKETAV